MANKNISAGLVSHPNKGVAELEQLIRDCIERKIPAQRIFYEQYAPALFNIICRYVYNESVACELLNDAFYKIFLKLDQYQWKGPVEAWMRRIAVNTITDHLRRHGNDIRYEQLSNNDFNDDDAYIDNEAISNLSFKELVGYLHALSSMQRTVFNLYVFENLPHGEIATRLSISEGNSRWILADARRQLKQMILKEMK